MREAVALLIETLVWHSYGATYVLETGARVVSVSVKMNGALEASILSPSPHLHSATALPPLPMALPQNHLVGKGERRSRLGYQAYDKIGARPETLVVQDLVQYARSQGLWRFEETPRYEHAGAQPPTGELAA